MRNDLALAYLVFDVSNLPAWQRFCGQVLGLPEPLSKPVAALAGSSTTQHNA